MTGKVDHEELQRQRQERRRLRLEEKTASTGDGSEVEADGPAPGTVDVPEPRGLKFAQGRPQPMLRLDEIPEAIDAPDADGPLSADEEERWEMCQRGFRQAKDAWFVAAKLLDLALRGRLWRRDYATRAEFIKAETGMSTSNAYRQIGGSEVAAILAGSAPLELEGPPVESPSVAAEALLADATATPEIERESNVLSRMRDNDGVRDTSPAPSGAGASARSGEAAEFERESNILSRMRDNDAVRDAPEVARPPAQRDPLVISQRAAEALTSVREDYGPPTAAEAYRTISNATGKAPVSAKLITAVLSELPRKEDEPLTASQVQKRIRSIVQEQARRTAAPDPVREYAGYVEAARVFAGQMEGLADAYKKAVDHDQAAAELLTQQLREFMTSAVDNFPAM